MRTTARKRARMILPVLLLVAGLLATTSPIVGAQEPQPQGPFVGVHMNADFTVTRGIGGSAFEPGREVTLTVKGTYLATNTVDESGRVRFDEVFPLEGDDSLVEGDVVTLTDDGDPQQMASLPMPPRFTLTDVDPLTDTLQGTQPPECETPPTETTVVYCVTAIINPQPGTPPPAQIVFIEPDENGNWVADFTGIWDIRTETQGTVQVPSGNGTVAIGWVGSDWPVEVGVDIKPGSDTNRINLKSNGVIPVAILTTDDFDATTVEPLSVRFGRAGASEAHGRGHFSDVDHDGDIDLMFHFRTQETGIRPVDSRACLTGETFDGEALQGCDAITVKGGSNVFGGHYYEVIEEPATWHDAATYCEQDGGYLVTINSAEENQFVYDLAPDVGGWLGATDEAVEGTWEWVTGEPFDYTNWGPGEPNNYAAGPDPTLGEDYLAFHGEGAYDPPLPGVWNDWQYEDDGSESTLPFVCEYEPTT